MVSWMVFVLSACGGDNASRETANTSTPKVTGPTEAIQEISVTVDGRKVSGHCVGGTPGGSPTVILESGVGSGQDVLRSIEEDLATRTMVCAYDRAGIGQSDPPAKSPRPVTDLVSYLHGFLAAAKIDPPYLLVGQSLGASIVFMYAQAFPGEVAGFVSMNPVPPYTDWIRAARKVETKTELHDYEIVFYEGGNDEQVLLQSTDRMLEDPLTSMPYAVMFAEDCGGDSEFCGRVLPPLSAATRTLADVGPHGSFVWVKHAGHEIYVTDLDTVLKTIDAVWSQI